INTISRESTDYLRVSGLLSAFTALVFANIFHAHYGLDFTWVLLGLLVSGYYLTKRSLFGKITDLEILGVKVDNITMDGAVGRVKELFKTQKKGYVVTPNPEFIMSAIKDKEFTQILNKADLSVPDGAGLVWASRIWGTPLQGRVAGRDLFWELCLEASRRGGRVFLLGAAPGVAEKTAQVLKRRIPKIKIAGTFAGDGSPKGDEETINRINQSAHQPIDLLFVAYGHGKQERWIKRNLNKVKVKVAVGVGGTFDYVSGQAVLAPKFIRRLGLEWLYRLAREPWRMKRQWALLPFSFLTFKESFRR
ncbi:MAG: WecB/TagA/CpsF family glycosyltransferase, partial [Patescibacteria group bacterium]